MTNEDEVLLGTPESHIGRSRTSLPAFWVECTTQDAVVDDIPDGGMGGAESCRKALVEDGIIVLTPLSQEGRDGRDEV